MSYGVKQRCDTEMLASHVRKASPTMEGRSTNPKEKIENFLSQMSHFSFSFFFIIILLRTFTSSISLTLLTVHLLHLYK